MKRMVLSLFSGLVVSALLVACGGSSSTSNPPPSQAATGRFIDAPVKGIRYSYGNYSGMTDEFGTFNYLTNSPITFKVGDVVLGSTIGKGIITPIDLVTNGKIDDPAVLNIVSFLMTIDDASNVNGLTISPWWFNTAKGKTFAFANTTSNSKFNTFMTGPLGCAGAVPRLMAFNHLTQSIYNLFIGTYKGSFVGTGAATGTTGNFSLTISTSGAITGSYTFTSGSSSGQSGNLTGQMLTNYSFLLTDGDTTVAGQIDPASGQFSGVMTAANGKGADFTGTKQ
jgi:hypothetical protein